MPRNLNDLANDLRKVSGTLGTIASNHAIEVAVSLIKQLVITTPVDTSKAISNWIVSLGSPVSFVLQPHSKGKKGSSRMESASIAIGDARGILTNKKPGQSIYVQNNASYIKRLNEGSSTQAPAGFVEAAILFARKIVGGFSTNE